MALSLVLPLHSDIKFLFEFVASYIKKDGGRTLVSRF